MSATPEVDMVEVTARVQNLEKISTEFEAMKSKMAEMEDEKKKNEEAAKAAKAKAEEEKKDNEDKMGSKGIKAKIAAVLKAMEEPDEKKKEAAVLKAMEDHKDDDEKNTAMPNKSKRRKWVRFERAAISSFIFLFSSSILLERFSSRIILCTGNRLGPRIFEANCRHDA